MNKNNYTTNDIFYYNKNNIEIDDIINIIDSSIFVGDYFLKGNNCFKFLDKIKEWENEIYSIIKAKQTDEEKEEENQFIKSY